MPDPPPLTGYIGASSKALEHAEVATLGFMTLGTVARMQVAAERVRSATRRWTTMHCRIVDGTFAQWADIPSNEDIVEAGEDLLASFRLAFAEWSQVPKWRRTALGLAQHHSP